MRHLKGRKGAPVAVKAGATKIGEAHYNTLTKGIDYVKQGIAQYTEQIKKVVLTE